MSGVRRVLLIEDEEDIRRVAQLSLERIGRFDVLLAGSGAEGLALAEAEQPDAILIDYMMPDLDGPETIRRLRANPATASIPVVMLTAMAAPGGAPADAGLGVVAVFAKPFDPISLPRELARVLGWTT